MVSLPIQTLIARVTDARAAASGRTKEDSLLETNVIISNAATFYEKVRYLIDYREEHTIRRSAIERIVKRQLFIEQRDPTAEFLLKELVEGRYITKEQVTDGVTERIASTLSAFSVLSEKAKIGTHGEKLLASLAASEIEAALEPMQYAIDTATADALYETSRASTTAKSISDAELSLQLYSACQRSLLRSDDAMLGYALWNMSVPDWRQGTADMNQLIEKVPQILTAIDTAVTDPQQWQLMRYVRNESIFFQIIRELYMQEGAKADSILVNAEARAVFIRDFLKKKFEKENKSLQSSGLRAVVYLLITKITLIFVAELPYEFYLLGTVNYIPLAINAIFHPSLLFLLTRKVGFPGDANTEAIVKGVARAMEGKAKKNVVQQYGGSSRFVYGILYFLIALGVFGGIVSALQALDFTMVGGVLFLFFLALVMYFAFRIRFRASQWRVIQDERMLTVVAAILVTPIIRTGRWLSRQFSTINVFVIFMDFIIETPFKFLLNFSHQFLRYLSEKANEVY